MPTTHGTQTASSRRTTPLLSELFDGAGPFARGLGHERLSEGLTRTLQDGDADQRAAAEQSVAASRDASRARTIEFHSRIAEGQLTEDSFLRGRALAERPDYPADAIDQLSDRV